MPQRRINAWYGWRPDTPDFRDLYLVQAPSLAPLPPHVDLRDKLPPSYDQGELGSCTANATAAAIEFDQRKQKLRQQFTPSRLFIYYNTRAMEGTIGEDSGAQIRDAIKSVNLFGAPPETKWGYKIDRFADKPGNRVYAEGKKHVALKYQRVKRTMLAMRGCLAAGFPFLFGFTCYDGFESDEVARTGVVNLPTRNEGLVGGHAVLAVGYDDESGRFLVRNSWATDWGMAGAFTLPYEYLLDANLSDDFWTLRLVS